VRDGLIDAAMVTLAAVFWFVTFALPWGVFWVKIAIAASILAALSLILDPPRRGELTLSLRGAGVGALSVVVLWAVFYVGNAVSAWLFPFAGRQVDMIYGKGAGYPGWVIALLLLLVTSPAEELFWRRFLQRRLAARWGAGAGWLAAAAVYAAVHVSSGNFMLVGAAAVAGLFWGAMYWWLGRIPPVIVSHALWTVLVFVVAPIG